MAVAHMMGKGRKKKAKTKKVKLGSKGSFSVHPGALHRALGVPEGTPLGAARVKKALKSKNPRIRRMAASASGLRAMRKG